MKIFIDADGCPVVDITVETAKEHKIECIIICDTAHLFSRDDVQVVTVEKGADSADFKLVNMIGQNDIAVTQDYGLAAMCLSRGAYAISQNGLLYTADNIDGLLSTRHMSKKLRMSGGKTKGPKKRTEQQNIAYKTALEKLICGE